MLPKNDKKYTASLQTEIDASYLYGRLAAAEEVPSIADLFRTLSGIEREHASKMVEKLQQEGINITLPPPSWRALALNRIGRLFGYGYVIGVLMDTEKSITAAQLAQKEKNQVPISGDEANHVKILQTLLNNQGKVTGENIARIEGKHKSIGGNALRAAVLGANDGLVSNMSLVMGVSGATDGGTGVLLAGMAGLLAGALSMALGEWISVKSSQELYERQMALEMLEIESNPEGEMQELALIYIAKGIPEDQAFRMAKEAIADPSQAYEILVKEELGINTADLQGSAWEAAITSFLLFAIGAIIPVIPFFYTAGLSAVMQSVLFSTVGLFIIGSAITLFTGKSVWYSGLRQVLFGLAAAAITYVIGKVIGVTLAG